MPWQTPEDFCNKEQENWNPELDTTDNYCEGIVDDLLQKVSTGDDHSFVGLFIKDPEGADMLKSDEKKFRVYIRDMVLNFLIAGRDTTAECLTWTLFELAQAPQVVDKARAEVSRVCGDKRITFEHLTGLRYIKAILDEGLRLHPSVPLGGKLTVAKDTLPNGIVVPAGVVVQFNAFAQGRSEEFWGEDAAVFRPERWLQRLQPSPYEFVAFNAGPRECLGKRLAGVEMTTFLASFIRDFDFELAIDPADVKYGKKLTLGCSNGLPMRVTGVGSRRSKSMP